MSTYDADPSNGAAMRAMFPDADIMPTLVPYDVTDMQSTQSRFGNKNPFTSFEILDLQQVSLAAKTGEGKKRETCNTWHAHAILGIFMSY